MTADPKSIKNHVQDTADGGVLLLCPCRSQIQKGIADSLLTLCMSSPQHLESHAWRQILHELENAFGTAIPEEYLNGACDLEQLLITLSNRSPDPGKQGRFVIQHELRQEVLELIPSWPSEHLTDTTAMTALFPSKERKALMQQLQTRIDWKLPRLGLPIWAQTVWGAGMLIGFVLQFIYPFWGMPLFWGGMLLSFQVEKIAWAFQYPTWAAWIDRTVAINWPALEMGAADGERVRVAFTELCNQVLEESLDPRDHFPVIQIHDLEAEFGQQTHVLHGDALRLTMERIAFPGARIVMRECMAVGPVQAWADFYQGRADFIHAAYHADHGKYAQWVMTELEKLKAAPADVDINLWFEDDLFCQANLWFLIHFLRQNGRTAGIYRVLPIIVSEDERWSGFGNHDLPLLEQALQARILLIERDIDYGSALWQGYQQNDLPHLTRLANTSAPQWRGLSEAVAALADRQPDAEGLGRPERILKAILAEHTTFERIFAEFSARAGVYGYGDLQVQALLDGMQAQYTKQGE